MDNRYSVFIVYEIVNLLSLVQKLQFIPMFVLQLGCTGCVNEVGKPLISRLGVNEVGKPLISRLCVNEIRNRC